MGFSSEVLALERRGGVCTLWLNRPEKHNALSLEMWSDLPLALAEIGADDSARVMILAGRGKSFCSGIDMAALASLGRKQGAASQATANLRGFHATASFQAGITALAECPVPVIAAIHGACVGGGVDLITACDIRLAAEGSRFSVRETKMGLAADVGSLQRLPKVLTAGHVAELVYTGKDIDAERARAIGLVNEVYPDQDALLRAANALGDEIAANAPLAVRGSKFMLRHAEDLTTEQSLLLNNLWTAATNLPSNDMTEAIKAFMEKRAPEFTGT